MSETFAVRWARRPLKRMFTMDYTKWHGSKDGTMFTFCGIPVPVMLEGTFLPETDDIQKVNCRKCSRLLTPHAADEATGCAHRAPRFVVLDYSSVTIAAKRFAANVNR